MLWFAVFLKYGVSEFSWVLLSSVFMDLYGVGDQRNPEIPLEPELEVSQEWNEVSNLMLEEEDFLLEAAGYTKRKRDEVALGRRKRRKENDIQPEKHLHSPTASRRIQNPEGFHSEDWNEVQQEEDEWQAPDK